jgi:3-oxoacyl-[acyl-carrier protein] reductase
MAQEGVAVGIADINSEWAEKTRLEITQEGGRALAIPCDVSDAKQVQAAIHSTVQEFDQIDILINDAVSPLLTGSWEELGDAEWDDNYRVNVKANFYCVKAVAPLMKQRRYGKIINMASVVGRRGSAPPTSAAYAASKGAIIAMTSSAARELGPHNINVNAIAPGQIDTPRWRDARTPEQIETTVQSTAVKRLGQPEDLTALAMLLASDASSFITGQTITVDGGALCM